MGASGAIQSAWLCLSLHVSLSNHLTSLCINVLRTWIKFANTFKMLRTEPGRAACGVLSILLQPQSYLLLGVPRGGWFGTLIR